MNNEWPFDRNHTPDDLKRLRAESVAHYLKHNIPIEEFTCDKCPSAPYCDLVFDGYNTDGDCLADK